MKFSTIFLVILYLIDCILIAHKSNASTSAVVSPISNNLRADDDKCQAKLCAQKATEVKQMATVLLSVPPLILFLCIAVAAATIWYFFNVINREMDEIDSLLDTFIAAVQARNVPVDPKTAGDAE